MAASDETNARKAAEKRAVTSEPIHDLLARRWSPRAIDEDRPLERSSLVALLEAARWAPSCFGEEPWRYVVCDRSETPAAWEDALACLVEGNRSWARRAPVLLVSVAITRFSASGRENRWAGHDVGAASENLCLQAAALGLVVHQMGGFDAAETRRRFALPEDAVPMAIIAVGHPGDPEVLDEKRRERELAPRRRRPLGERFFAGRWSVPYEAGEST